MGSSGDDLATTVVASSRCRSDALRCGLELNATLRANEASGANTALQTPNQQSNERHVRQENSASGGREQASVESGLRPADERELAEAEYDANDGKQPLFPAFHLLHRRTLTLEGISRV